MKKEGEGDRKAEKDSKAERKRKGGVNLLRPLMKLAELRAGNVTKSTISVKVFFF